MDTTILLLVLLVGGVILLVVWMARSQNVMLRKSNNEQTIFNPPIRNNICVLLDEELAEGSGQIESADPQGNSKVSLQLKTNDRTYRRDYYIDSIEMWNPINHLAGSGQRTFVISQSKMRIWKKYTEDNKKLFDQELEMEKLKKSNEKLSEALAEQKAQSEMQKANTDLIIDEAVHNVKSLAESSKPANMMVKPPQR